MGGQKGRLNALIEASAQGERAESTSGRSGSLPPFRRSSEAELSAAGIRLKEQNDADKMWIRDLFLKHKAPHEKYVVHGHTPLAQWCRTSKPIASTLTPCWCSAVA
jgi:hypothetical protein